jgi:hypothetical protein
MGLINKCYLLMDLITLLVPDSSRATEGNGNGISADVTDDTIENDYNNSCFSCETG